ncbi:MAG: hypothetical protein NT003_00020 [Candidatus Magasanikbacteria bacterium]|nr:hypothetical protein [Candidatus Magasanikbacteria bacterium]
MIGYRIKNKNIICEMYLPNTDMHTAVIILPGLPSYIGKNLITKTLCDAGFHVFQPFYSGSFDSKGSFTPQNCINDVNSLISRIKSGVFTELRYKHKIYIRIERIVVCGISFGASIATLISNNSAISGLILISPILTYNQKIIESHSKNTSSFFQEMKGMTSYLKRAYPRSYNIIKPKYLDDFLFGRCLDPLTFLSENSHVPILILSSKNDAIIPGVLIKNIIDNNLRKIGTRMKIKKGSGHGLSSFSSKSDVTDIINFIKKL